MYFVTHNAIFHSSHRSSANRFCFSKLLRLHEQKLLLHNVNFLLDLQEKYTGRTALIVHPLQEKHSGQTAWTRTVLNYIRITRLPPWILNVFYLLSPAFRRKRGNINLGLSLCPSLCPSVRLSVCHALVSVL